MIRSRVLAAAFIFAAALVFFFTPMRSAAQSMWNGFVRDSVGNLLVENLTSATTISTTPLVTTSTTTQLYAASTKPTYIYWLGVQSGGANSGAVGNIVYSPVAACASSTTPFLPVNFSTAITAGTTLSIFGTNNGSIGVGASVPFVLPAGNYVCLVTTGGTVSLYGVMYSSQVQ